MMTINSGYFRSRYYYSTYFYGTSALLQAKYNLTVDEGFSFMGYVMGLQVFETTKVDTYLSTWRKEANHSGVTDIQNVNIESLTKLLSLFNIQIDETVFSREYSELDHILSGGKSEKVGILWVVCGRVQSFYYMLKYWHLIEEKRILNQYNYPGLYAKRKEISKCVKRLKKLEKKHEAQRFLYIILRKSFNRIPYVLGEILMTYTVKGSDFDETDPKDIECEYNRLLIIYDYLAQYIDALMEFELLLKSSGIKTENEVYNLHHSFVMQIRAEERTRSLIAEYEAEIHSKQNTNTDDAPQKEAEKVISLPISRSAGRPLGSWRTSQNKLSEAIWSSVFYQLWDGLYQKVSIYNYPKDLSAKKKSRIICYLSICQTYVALEQLNLAVEYGTSGSKSPFINTWTFLNNLNYQSMDEFMPLIRLVLTVQSIWKSDTLNYRSDGLLVDSDDNSDDDNNQDDELFGENNDDRTKVRSKSTQRKPDKKKDVQTPVEALMLFRKEHPTLYSYLGADLITPSFEYNDSAEILQNNNIKSILQTLSWLRLEIYDKYNNIIAATYKDYEPLVMGRQ